MVGWLLFLSGLIIGGLCTFLICANNMQRTREARDRIANRLDRVLSELDDQLREKYGGPH